MTREEVALQVVQELQKDSVERWRDEATAGPLNEVGDNIRRMAAVKIQVFNEIVGDLVLKVKGRS